MAVALIVTIPALGVLALSAVRFHLLINSINSESFAAIQLSERVLEKIQINDMSKVVEHHRLVFFR